MNVFFPSQSQDQQWLVGGGEMGDLIRSLDWSATPLGPLESWPHSLRTTVSLCLASNFPINILWGPGSNQIYNDGYRVIVGEKHPEGMGMGYKECWESAWPQVGPPFERAWGGNTSFIENQRMFLTRSGYLEETFFTFSLSPIRDEHGIVAGLFHPVTETTAQMLSQRRTRALRELAANTSEARTLEQAFERCVETFAEHSLDLPFVLLYSVSDDGAEARLVSSTGVDRGLSISPATIRLDDEAYHSWEIPDILAADAIVEIAELKARFGEFACGPYPEGANLALARALRVPGVSAPLGIIIAGISPRLPFHQEYRDHVEQVASATATALGNALAYQGERKRAEELAALDRAKTQFFSNVSHEFRTPLTLMLGPLDDVLEHARALSPEMREPLEVARRNSLRLLRLVNSLLDFSRIEAGRAKAVYQPTDLSALTAELVSNFRSATERAGLRLTIECPPLPEPVLVDTEMWEQVVLNLVSNAFKFTFEGGITVRLTPVEHAVELSVNDTGTGIPEQELPRLFERFHRVEGSRGRTFEGTGIGLALVQELVKLHGGSITAESVVDQGSTFRVRIPLGAAHLPAEQVGGVRELVPAAVRAEAFVAEAIRWLPDGIPAKTLSSEPTLGASAALPLQASGGSVLVVDDNADMRDYVRRLLNERYKVLTAANGQEGLAVALRQRPDLVLTDIMMPVMDGMDLLRALRARSETSTIPIIFLSARAGEESRSEGMDAGADDYVVKPFGARELLARIGAHMQMARMRKAAEETLRESEKKYRELFESMIEAYCVIEMIFDENQNPVDFRYVETNRAFVQHTGQPMLGKRIKDIVPDFEQIWLDQYGRVALTGEPVELEHVVAGLGNQWFHTAAYRIGGEGSHRVAVVFENITERKKAEQALRESEERLRLATEHAEIGLWDVDEINKALLWPPRVKAMFGISGDVPVSLRDFYDGLHPEDRAATGAAYVAAADPARRALYDVQYRTIGKEDGRIRWVAAKGRGVFDDSGRCVRVIGTAIDITERKRMERALAASEERLQQVFTQAPVAVAVLRGPDLVFELANPSYQEFFPGRQLVGRPLIAAMPEVSSEHLAILQGVLNTGEPFIGHEYFAPLDRDRDGILEDCWFTFVYQPWRQLDGSVVGVMVVAVDVSTHVRARQEMERVNKELEEFAYVASHDLQEPLRMVNIYSQLLAKRFGTAGTQAEEYAEFVRQGVSRMEMLIRDLLSYSRTVQREELPAGAAELSAALSEAQAILQSRIEESGAVIHAGPLPSVRGETKQLAHVFQNLLSNALKYRNSDRQPTVHITAKQQSGQWIIAVRDNGIGFEQQYAERIFGLFKRLHKDEYPGTGLGLAICQRIVERYGGRMWAEGRLGEGATFYFALLARDTE